MNSIAAFTRICNFLHAKDNIVSVLKIAIFLIAGFFSIISYGQQGAMGLAENTLSSVENVVQGAQAKVNEIENVLNTVKENNLYKSLIDGKEFKFPIGVLPNDGDRNYALVINKVFMTPDGMYAEVFMKITVSSKTTLYFLADKVPYSRTGGFAGDLRLYLLVTDSIQVGRGYNIEFRGLTNALKAGSTGVGLKPNKTEECCFITFNCKGFKDVTLAGSVNFDKRTIVDNSKTKNPVSVKYYVQAAAKLSNFVIDLKDIPSFEFTSLPGFKCYIPRFTLDHSELKNAPDFKLPQWYKDSIALIRTKNFSGDTTGAGNYNLDGVQWKGIYVDSLVIDIPKAFKEKKPDEIIVITASNIIIDGNGITGLSKAAGKNNTPFYDGTLKGWEYSIDKLSFNMIASCLSSASITGGITLPISKKGRENQVGFSLLVSKNIADNDMSYAGFVDLKNTGTGGLINVQAFGLAKMQIKNALISFNYAAGQFTPSVNIEGSLTLMPKKKSTDTSAAAAAKEKPAAGFGVVFQRLIISTQAPYIDIDRAHGGYCKMSTGGQTMSNFPVSIDTISLIKEAGGQRVGIQISLQVQLQKSGSGKSGGSGFGGAATFTIWTKRDAVTKKWGYDDFSLDKIVIDVDNDAFKLHGELTTFRSDSLYGTGFCGMISLSLMKDKLVIEVAAIFGRTMEYVPDINVPVDENALISENDASYRYWFVDAGVTFPVIPVAPMVGINGFNGGLYHHMEMQQVGVLPKKPTTVKCRTTSGLTYIPNVNIHLGLLAGIGLQSVPTDAVFNGKITFGIEFSKSGGVNMLAFFGDVTIFTPPVNVPGADKLKKAMNVVPVDAISADKEKTKAEVPKEETPEKGSVRVKWFTQYVFPTKTFTGDFDVYVDVINVVTGGGEKKKAGHIAVMFSPTDKYVYMGIPADPISLEVVKLFECQAYFCAGNKLPSPPMMPLPAEFGDPPIDYDAMETGAGLSFGARVSLDGGFKGSADFAGCEVTPYAKIWVSAGFDILITQTSQPVYCSVGERGINNWYATGQAFIMGGINVGCEYDCKLLGSGDFTLVEASIAAYLFAQLPKPSYLIGKITVKFKLLNVIGGSATLSVKFGEECVREDLDKNIVFIESIIPATGSSNVDVTENIVVHFTKAIEKFQFELADETDGGKKVQYRGMVSESDVTVTAGTTVIPCEFKWNSDKTQLTLVPKVSYPENSKIVAIVSVQLQYNKGSGWAPSGKIEKDTTIFYTKMEPYKIAVSNVKYAYPMPGMKNYYKSESNTGYINLLSLPTKPMRIQPNFGYQVVFFDGSGEVARVKNVTVNNQSSSDQFTYPIPNASFKNGQAYTLKLMKVELVDQTRDIKDKDTTKTMGTYAAAPKDTTILEYTFTASKFGSFADKMAYYNVTEVQVSGKDVVHILTPNNKDVKDNKAEGFSEMETFGVIVEAIKTSQPFVRSVGADFSTGFSMNGVNLPDSIAYSYYSNKLFVQYNVFSELQTQNHQATSAGINCVVQNNVNTCNAGRQGSTFPAGKYYYKMGYYLPGKNIKTSEVVVGFDLPSPVTVQ